MDIDDEIIKSDGKITDKEIISSLRMAGVSFSIVVICTIIGPITKFLTINYGTFIASIFSVSTLIAFPFEAIYSRIKRKTYSVQSNLLIVILLSLLTFILFERKSKVILTKFIGFTFGIPITASIIIVYLILHEYVPQIIKRETLRDKLFYLLYVSIPTIIIFMISFAILHYSFGITIGFENLENIFGV